MVETRPPSGVPEHLLGRSFGAAGLGIVREELTRGAGLCRAQLAQRVCTRLGWRTVGGQLSLMSTRVALLRLERAGWIALPPPRNGNGNGRPVGADRVDWPEPVPLPAQADALPGLRLHPVQEAADSALYHALLARYHYLGALPLAGAQVRYLVGWEGGWLGALGFGAAAWQVRDRDQFIGWDHARRRTGLHRIVNNSRFLLLPWVRCRGLASQVLARSVRRLARDFAHRYGYRPVLVESFVEEGRFAGTCYRAANWQHVGWTQGRGKLGQWQDPRQPRKAIWLYPLDPRFRALLGGQEPGR